MIVRPPDFYDAPDVGHTVGSVLVILGDGESDVPVKKVGLVIMILILPGETQFLIY